MADLTPCKTCNKEVSRVAPACPHCGETLPGLRMKCPACDSRNVMVGQKGFGLEGAAAGLILAGPVGLLGGMIGRKRIELKCQACGKKWLPNPIELANAGWR